MKIFKFMTLALVAMLGFSSCSEDCNHEFIEVDYSKDLVGTWTCFEADYASALVFSADGSAISMGAGSGDYWENVDGTFSVENNHLLISFESGYEVDVRIDLIPNVSLSIVDKNGKRHTYRYCTNDLSDEIVGMWVSPSEDMNNTLIQTFNADGTNNTTGVISDVDKPLVNAGGNTYKVVGDLLFLTPVDFVVESGLPSCMTMRMTYTPNGVVYGDIMNLSLYITNGDEATETSTSFLRVKQSLDLADQKYDYIKTYVSNVKGEDKDIDFMGYTFNFAKMDGSGLDKMLKALLFAVEFPNANKLTYSYQLNNNTEAYDANIVVEGNKMTIKMSEKVATLKDVVLYAFQDADCSQMHFYMHKTAFVNFYTNMQAMLMKATDEQFDINNAEAVNAIYNEINNAVETINVSFVMSK